MEFLVFGEDWQRHPSSTQHLFALFNQQHLCIGLIPLA